MKRPTIKDIARESGFSVTTVSLALSGKPSSIPESTRVQIQTVAKNLHYSKNQMAASLKTQKSGIIGIVLPDMMNIHISSMFTYIDRYLRQKGYFLLTCTTNSSQEVDLERLAHLTSCGIDGLILLNPSTCNSIEAQQDLLSFIRGLSIPVVSCDNSAIFNQQLGSNVSVDYEKGAYLAVRYLLDQGHTSIGCVTGPMHMEVTELRTKGYKKALEESGIENRPSLLFEGNYESESGQKALPYLLGQGASAVFAYNDSMAFGILRSARMFNLKIPTEFSVIGFDDVYLDELMEIPLTSVHVPTQDIGQKIASEMIRLLESDSPSYKLYHYDPNLMIRASVADIRVDR